MQIMTCR